MKNEELKPILKCPECWAHYSGEHSCPEWMKALVSSGVTTTASEGKTLSLEAVKEAIDSMPPPFYIVDAHVHGIEEVEKIRERIIDSLEEKYYVNPLSGFIVVTDKTVPPGEMELHCSDGKIYTIKINSQK